MATLEETRNRVKRIIQDSSYTDETIDEFINEGYLRCASLVLLPELESTGSITLSSAAYSVDIPASWDFNRNLFLCVNPTSNTSLQVFTSLALFNKTFPEFKLGIEYGTPKACTISGNTLLYYPTPMENVDMQCAFYTNVSPLVNDADIPDSIPPFMQMPILAAYACKEIFSEIEDGIDGVLINFTKYTRKFEESIFELNDYLRAGQSRVKPARESDWV